MPLKHATETWLVFLLGLVVVLTGLVIAVLPPLPAGTLWWGSALVLSIAYPLSLYPLLKSRRADYPFRALHFAPFVLLLIRLLLDAGAAMMSGLARFAQWYSWAWAAPAVFLVLVLLAFFCIRVLRQRDTRLRLLAALFLPFVFLGLFSERAGWNEKMTAVLAGDTLIADVPESPTVANLNSSADAAEERWRAMLREREERRNALEGSGSLIGETSLHGVGHAHSLSKVSPIAQIPTPVVTTPPILASSGPSMETAAVSLIAAYCSVLHLRARRRVMV